MVTVTLNDMNPSAPNNVIRQSTRAIDLHSGYSEIARGNEDMALVYLPSPVSCLTLNGPQVARLPPFSNNEVSASPFDRRKNRITDHEIESAFCFATGWGLTRHGTFSDIPQNIYLRVKREDSDGLFGFPLNKASKACKGDSGSPVYCYIRGIKYLIGVMTDVGTYKELKRSSNDEMRCEDYDFVVIADIRANMEEVQNIFLQRGLGDNLAKGQKICHKIDF